MTDKQIIIDNVDVSGCSLYEDNPKYRMWGTCDCMRSMVDQSGYDELAGAECKGYNCYYKQLKRKEQECEELKEQLERADEDIKMKCTRCAMTNLLDEQLDQLKEQLEAYKMEAEEGKEINAELKAEQDRIKTICDNHFDEYEMGCLDLSDAIESLLERYDNAITGLTKQRKELKTENEELKQYKDVVDKLAGMQVILTNENGVPQLYDNAKDLKLKQLSQTLTEIKEIADIINDRTMVTSYICDHLDKILQKISEVENE